MKPKNRMIRIVLSMSISLIIFGLHGYAAAEEPAFYVARYAKPPPLPMSDRDATSYSLIVNPIYSQHVEAAINRLTNKLNISIANFTVAPSIINTEQKPYYEWYIETNERQELSPDSIANLLDEYLSELSDFDVRTYLE